MKAAVLRGTDMSKNRIVQFVVFGVPFALGFALSMSVYVIIMLVFFGIKLPIALYLIGAIALLGSYFYSYFFERRSAA
jgi:putative flippase GtrA